MLKVGSSGLSNDDEATLVQTAAVLVRVLPLAYPDPVPDLEINTKEYV